HHALGIDVADELRVEAAGNGGEERGHGSRAHLGMVADDAEALGGLGIVLHRAPPIAPLGILEEPGYEPGRARKREREIEIRDLVAWKLEQEPAVAANGDLDAEGGADPVPIEEQEVADLGDNDS